MKDITNPSVITRAFVNQGGTPNHVPAMCAKNKTHLIDWNCKEKKIKNGWWAIRLNPQKRDSIKHCILVCYKCYLELAKASPQGENR
jgi:hypothetical protein